MVNLQYQYAGMLTFPLWIDRKHELDISGYQLSIGNEDGVCVSKNFINEDYFARISFDNAKDLLFSLSPNGLTDQGKGCLP